MIWEAPVDNGGTPITDYQIWCDSGTGGALALVGSSLNQQEYTTGSTLTTGLTYRCKIRATNYIGTGPDSDIVALISAAPPEAPTQPNKY